MILLIPLTKAVNSFHWLEFDFYFISSIFQQVALQAIGGKALEDANSYKWVLQFVAFPFKGILLLSILTFLVLEFKLFCFVSK